jgi:competence protein ComEA
MKRFFWEYIYLSPQERRGVIVLIVISFASFIVPRLHRYYYQKPTADFTEIETQYLATFGDAAPTALGGPDSLFAFDPNTASFDDFVLLGLSERTASSICNYRDKGGVFRKPTDFKRIYTLSKADFDRLLPFIQIAPSAKANSWRTDDSRHFNVQEEDRTQVAGERFEFDPNQVTEADLKRMRLRPALIKSWINYRTKGGQFRKPDDLGKLYSMDDQTLQSLLPFVKMDVPTAVAVAPVTYQNTAKEMPKSAAKPVDINHSELADWMQLPGIGDRYAQRIVNFRTRLGGFVQIEQVGECYGLPDSVYQRIKPLLLVSPYEIRRLDINAATQKDISMHPYFDGAQARVIVAYRDRHGPFGKQQDFEKIAGLDPVWRRKVMPYIQFK